MSQSTFRYRKAAIGVYPDIWVNHSYNSSGSSCTIRLTSVINSNTYPDNFYLYQAEVVAHMPVTTNTIYVTAANINKITTTNTDVWDTTNVSDYRFGFNGQEKDNEIKGTGNSLIFTFRICDPRLGRWLSNDPLTAFYPMLTPYQFASNRPIDGIDLEGMEYISAKDLQRIGRYDPEFAKMTAEDVNAVTYKGQTYYRVGAHYYQGENGQISTDPAGQQVTQWVFTQIDPVIPESDYVPWNTKKDCYKNCQSQLGKQNNSSDAYWPTAFQMYKSGNKGKGVTDASKRAGLDALHKAVESGNAIMVGVDYGETTSQEKNIDKTTDHFITIVGRGNDENGEFFTFYENAINDQSKGTDVTTNKLYIQSDGTLKGNTTWSTDIRLTVTQVRPNQEKE